MLENKRGVTLVVGGINADLVRPPFIIHQLNPYAGRGITHHLRHDALDRKRNPGDISEFWQQRNRLGVVTSQVAVKILALCQIEITNEGSIEAEETAQKDQEETKMKKTERKWREAIFDAIKSISSLKHGITGTAQRSKKLRRLQPFRKCIAPTKRKSGRTTRIDDFFFSQFNALLDNRNTLPVGQDSQGTGQGGTGGNGLAWLNGTTYAGGGAGNSDKPSGSTISGGTGGGGSAISTQNGTAGTANTGGGGGGGASGGHTGGAGGSGVVIVRYKSASQIGSGGTVSSSGGFYYHTFTTSGTYTA